MTTGKALLSSLLKTAQMGQTGIRSVLDTGMGTGLRQALESQLREYDIIETEAHALASQRGWELRELDPAVRIVTDMMTRARLSGKGNDTRIADMMIRGNTRGMIRGLKDIHAYAGQDAPIRILSQKLLDCETANIREMKQFL